jgi:CheY-like chemotaxis protein
MSGTAPAVETRSEPPPSDASGALERRESQRGRFGGARADFVASLGRRIVEIRGALTTWQNDPRSIRARDDLRRKVHALAAGSRLLRFADLADGLAACEAKIDEIGAAGELTLEGAAVVHRMLERTPALAWVQDERHGPEVGLEALPEPTEPTRGLDAASGAAGPQTALVVGPPQLADALTREPGDGRDSAVEAPCSFDVERTEDPTVAIDLARAFAPDVVVVDADAPGARELVEALVADPLTEPAAVVVLGRFAKPEDAAPFVALGVARALPKPVSPDTLRRACAEAAATYVRREVVRSPLGEVSLDDLGARLAEELRKGLCDAASAQGRAARFDLGEGTDVLAALWGALARIRDVVTIRSDGAVRFTPSGPEGALPLAPWLGGFEAPGARGGRSATAPRAAAAVSLEKAVVVVADDDPAVTWFLAGVFKDAGAIVHEAKDGARALELAFRTAPDLVVSDILMPELDGFALCRALKRDLLLRDVPVLLLSWKEDLLQRVRELGAAADGYLRKEASASAIVQRVREVMWPRIRVGERLAAGGEVRGRLDGLTTHTLLALTCQNRPSSTLTVRDAAYLYEVEIRGGRPVRATRTAPDGTFQRGPAVLASLLGIGAGRFVVSALSMEAVRAPLRADLSGELATQLTPFVARARAAQRLLTGAALLRADRVTIEPAALGAYGDATPEPARGLLRAIAAGASPRDLIVSGQTPAHLVEDVLADAAAHGAIEQVFDATREELLGPAIDAETDVLLGARKPLAPLPLIAVPGLGLTPPPEPVASLDATPAPFPLLTPSPTSGTEAARAAVTPVLATIRADKEAPPAAPRVAPPSPAPTGPAASSVSPVGPASPAPTAADDDRRAAGVPATLGSLEPPPVEPRSPVPPRAAPPRAPEAPPSRELTPSQLAVRPSSFLHVPAPKTESKPREMRTSMWILFAALGLAFAMTARWARERTVPEPAPPPETAPPAAAPAPEPAPAPAPAAHTPDPSAEDAPLRADDKVAADQGMLEIVAGVDTGIFVDGRAVGRGPVVKLPLTAKGEPYEVKVELRGESQVRFVAIRQGRLTRLRVSPPWSR